jgi:hypothetical protein
LEQIVLTLKTDSRLNVGYEQSKLDLRKGKARAIW